jgi:predicted metal-dependent hydrolase
MEKTLAVAGGKISYRMKRSRRARNVRLSVSCEGAVAVTLPWFVPDMLAERFVRAKADWILRKVAEMVGREKPLLAKTGKREYGKHKDEALAFVTERVLHWNRVYGFEYRAVSVRNQKTRWGSCSKQGNLSFNWKLLLLPAEMADYVVVHELCHRAHFDHSSAFWALVARTVPGYRDIRKRMKKL